VGSGRHQAYRRPQQTPLGLRGAGLVTTHFTETSVNDVADERPMSGTRSPSSTDPCDDTSCMWTKGDGSLRITLPVTHFLNGKAGHHVGPRRPPPALVLSIAASFALLSSCSPIDPGAAQLPTAAAPTNVGSAVQYTVPTARQNGSECLPVDCAVLRGLLVHAAFNGTLGFPGEGRPKKRFVCCFVISCSD
jgi:hypothetical protein